MEQSNGVKAASPKPTPDDVKKKREALLASLRKNGSKPVDNLHHLKPLPAKDVPTAPEQIHAASHTFRLKRMVLAFGQEAITALERDCVDHNEFKMELMRAEQLKAMPTPKPKISKQYDPMPDSHGAKPVEVEWNGEKYLIDAQTKFKVEYCDKLIKWMKFGRSLKSFSGEIMVPYSTVKEWLHRYKILQDAYEIAHSQSLGLIENLLFNRATGMDVSKMSEQFDVKKADNKVLTFLARSRFREEFFEKVQLEHGATADLAELKGEELEKAVTKLRTRLERLQSPNPFGQVNLYKGEQK